MGGPRDDSAYSLGAKPSAEVAAKVRELMKVRGETQLSLSKKLDMPQGHISNLLSGVKRFQQWQIEALADALGTTEAALLPAGLAGRPEPAAMSDQERMFEASKEAFVGHHHPGQLSDDDVRFLRESRLRLEGDDLYDDDYWWGLVNWHRKQVERRRAAQASPVTGAIRPEPSSAPRPRGSRKGRR